MVSRPRLLLADDHLETVALLRKLLQPEFEVVGHVSDGRALIRDAQRLSPDVIVSDISMPGVDGITAATVILHANPAARVVLVTVDTDPATKARALAAGVLGFVMKVAAGEELIPAIRAALCGQRCVSGIGK